MSKWGTNARRPIEDLRDQFGPILAKVMSRVKLGEHGCWEWQGYKNRLGYGETSWKGKVYMLTRLVYAAVHGLFDKDLDICHTCDNPGCCNPDHLRLGTDAENVDDRITRGRDHHSNLTHCPHGHPYEAENLWVDSRGFRHCRTCIRAKGQKPEYIAWRREYQRKRRQELKAKKLAESSLRR